MMRKFILVSTLVLSSSVAFAQFTGPSVERDSQTQNDRKGQMQDRPCVNNPDGQPCDFHPQNHPKNADQEMNRQHRQQMNQQNHRHHQRGEGHRRGEHRQMHKHEHQEHREYRNHDESRHGQYHRNNQRSGEMRQHSGNRQHMNQ